MSGRDLAPSPLFPFAPPPSLIFYCSCECESGGGGGEGGLGGGLIFIKKGTFELRSKLAMKQIFQKLIEENEHTYGLHVKDPKRESVDEQKHKDNLSGSHFRLLTSIGYMI